MALKPEQYDAIRLMAQPKAVRPTQEVIADTVGVTTVTLWRWSKDDAFMRELKREIIRQSASRLPDVIESMANAAIDDKNAAAAKLIMQAHELLGDKLTVETTEKKDVPDIEELKRMLSEDSE